jgi:hypothetical protein
LHGGDGLSELLLYQVLHEFSGVAFVLMQGYGMGGDDVEGRARWDVEIFFCVSLRSVDCRLGWGEFGGCTVVPLLSLVFATDREDEAW